MTTRHERNRGARKSFYPATLTRMVILTVVLLPLFAGGTSQVLANSKDQGAVAPYRDGIVLMAFRDGIGPRQQDAILSRVGGREIKQIGVGVHVLSVKPGQVLQAVTSLQTIKEVRYAEPDYLEKVSAGTLPNDTTLGFQWAHRNTGQSVNGTSGTSGADERTYSAWGITTGTNSVVVAVLDTGVQYTHPDLITNMWNNPGGVGGCPAGTHGYNVLASNCDPMDDEFSYGGHGTHVAGIIGAVGNNAAGTAGVNWTTSIMAVKWVNSADGTGANSDLISAMDWVVKAFQAGVNVRIVNDSQTWAGVAYSQAVLDEINVLGNNHILFVTASGNTAQNNDNISRYPCSYSIHTMICAAASDQNDGLWSQSNYGSNSVHLVAPGVNIFSTLDHSNYGYITGGSMAAPQVSGAAALILSMGYLNATNLKSAMLNNVDVLSSLNGLVSSSGRLNICAAIPGCKSAVPGTLVSTAVPVVTSIPQQGGLLGASTGFWTGIPSTYTYQWNRCDQSGLNCSLISGATGQTYAQLAPADALATLAVTVTASNSFGSVSVQSAPSGAVATATSSSPISSSIVSGTSISGSVPWSVTPSRSEQFVQFYIDGVLAQTDATSPYVFNGSSSGLLDTTAVPNGPHVLGARALFTDNRTYDFYGESVTVANTPQNTALPTISGTLVPGQAVSTSNGSWTANAPPTGFSYQWEHCDSSGSNCAFISGAAASTYTLSGADTNFTMRSVVTASNSGGSAAAVSTQTGVVPPPPLAITTSSLPGGIQNTSYSATVTATGGLSPYTWSITAGNLPNGLTLSPGSGVIFGNPTVTGMSNFTVQVMDTRSVTTTMPLSLTVAVPLTVTTTSLPNGTQLASYSATLAATGGTPPYTWSIFSGTLPSGLTLSSSSGVISGTSTVTGTSNFTVQVRDANSLTNSKPLNLTMNNLMSGGSGIALVQANSVQGSGVGSVLTTFPVSNTAGNLILAFMRMSTSSQTVTVSDSAGNTYVQAVAQVQNSDGSQARLFYAKNILGASANTVTATFSSTNNHPWLAIYEFKGLSTTNPLDQVASTQGNGSTPNSGATPTTTGANELVFGAMGLASTYSNTQTAGSGFTMLENDTGTSPAANELMLVSSTGSYTASFTLGGSPNWDALVATFAAGAPVVPVVTTTSLPNGPQNSAYGATLTATGGTAPLSWSITAGTLPVGLTLASTTGVISGTPTGTGTNNFTTQVTDANFLTATKPLSLTVIAPPSISTASLPIGILNAAYSVTVTASGGTTPYTWSLSAGNLPAGLTLASSTGVISGTPTGTGTSNFTVQVTDAGALKGTKALSIVVSAVAAPTITTASPFPNATQNVTYSHTVSATGGTMPYTWTIASGTLPTGLTINSSTGTISGTPTVTGTVFFTVQVTDAGALSGTKRFSITVAAVGQNLFQLTNVVNNLNAAPGQTSITANMVITSGHFLVAFVSEGLNATDNFTISDSSGNKWVQTASGYCSGSNTNRCGMFYSKATFNSSNPTANFTTPGGVGPASITVMDFNIPGEGGGADAVSEEGSVNSLNSSASALTSGTLKTTGSSDVLIYAVGVGTNQTSWTADAAGGFAIPSNKLTTGASGSNARTAVEYKTIIAPSNGTTILTGSTGGTPMGGVFAGFSTSAVGP